jgi:hypothetical protein
MARPSENKLEKGLLVRLAFVAFPDFLAQAASAAFNESTVLAAAFTERGAALQIVDAFDRVADWDRYDAVLPLGCWGYYEDAAGFLAWVDMLVQKQVRLVNAPAILRWNLDKSYLLDLAQKGATVAPLLHFPRGSRPALAAELARLGWSRYVLKPTISANALHILVGEGRPGAEELALSEKILTRAGLLVQPFFTEITEEGQWSLLFFGGVFSHAVRKRPRAGDFRSQPNHGAVVQGIEPPASVIAQAAALLTLTAELPVYARVDGFLRDGRLHLIELELLEPALFLRWADPGAAGRFADAVLSHLKSRRE